MQVRRISPAPFAATVRAKSTASMPVARRPPWVKISHFPGPTVLASMATTMHCDPKRSAASATTSGSATAAELKLTLSAPGQQQRAHVLGRADPAADGQRHEALLGGAGDEVEHRAAVVVGRHDVEKAELVRAGGVIGLCGLDRVAGVDQVDEVDALDDAAVGHVKAGDDAGLEHGFHMARAGSKGKSFDPGRGCCPVVQEGVADCAAAVLVSAVKYWRALD